MRLESPAPFKDKAQLHEIGSSEQRRRDEDDEGILPDRSIEATCQQQGSLQQQLRVVKETPP